MNEHQMTPVRTIDNLAEQGKLHAVAKGLLATWMERQTWETAKPGLPFLAKKESFGPEMPFHVEVAVLNERFDLEVRYVWLSSSSQLGIQLYVCEIRDQAPVAAITIRSDRVASITPGSQAMAFDVSDAGGAEKARSAFGEALGAWALAALPELDF
ncbi:MULTISPECIES: hypothetical protein [Paraburkholderia]|uniref:Uncharacterized protein n=1 Tax=Paraburkholderia madseniana TaxID=2599607 RepID=A0AAP5F1X5_9BURK|nr:MULTISPECIES: hypothetical protein [Paraburkholderia]MCX4151986.1 hypothetical protein [Paraburkholderia madseniana]MCX4175595.1 hypothetical protein [Paraburkholderia madseniana]MDN7154914.1 hypothetical protein [Paraburkholderia sp. WS6]MDQ6413797.1 hypothetical protein [Paraburkholderia madseniana]MDQ6463591.1 hypothetical protein [Paraburkholderia madseniana]